MNKEKAEKILVLVQALVDGKQLQSLNGDINNQWWSDDNDPNFNLPDLLRVKPEGKRLVLLATETMDIAIRDDAGLITDHFSISGPCEYVEKLDD